MQTMKSEELYNIPRSSTKKTTKTTAVGNNIIINVFTCNEFFSDNRALINVLFKPCGVTAPKLFLCDMQFVHVYSSLQQFDSSWSRYWNLNASKESIYFDTF